MTLRALILVGAAAMLAACGQQPAEPAPAEPDPVVAPAASAQASVAYECEGDLRITAVYGTDASGERDVAIFIQGQDFQMTRTDAPSGDRFVTPYGLEAGKGLIWWEEDGTARLQQAPEEQLNDPAAGVTARTCTQKAASEAE